MLAVTAGLYCLAGGGLGGTGTEPLAVRLASWVPWEDPVWTLETLRASGTFAVGWGTGVVGWLASGHQAAVCFFVKVRWAWLLRRRNVLTSGLPVLKYAIAGSVLLGLGGVLGAEIWGLWNEAYDTGLVAGALTGALHSGWTVRWTGSPIDFLEANQRFVNEDRTALFTQYDKP